MHVACSPKIPGSHLVPSIAPRHRCDTIRDKSYLHDEYICTRTAASRLSSLILKAYSRSSWVSSAILSSKNYIADGSSTHVDMYYVSVSSIAVNHLHLIFLLHTYSCIDTDFIRCYLDLGDILSTALRYTIPNIQVEPKVTLSSGIT